MCSAYMSSMVFWMDFRTAAVKFSIRFHPRSLQSQQHD